MATEQKKSWAQKLRSSFGKNKTAAKETEDKATQNISEASTAVQEAAAQTSEATQDAMTQATQTAEPVVEQAKETMNKTAASVQETAQAAASSTEEQAKDLGITFSDEPTQVPVAPTAAAAVPAQMPSSSTSWLDQVKDGLHQGFNTVSQKTMEGYEAAKDMMTKEPTTEGPSWTESFKTGFNQGVTTVTQKTSAGYEAAKEYMAGSTNPVTGSAAASAEPSTTNWTEQFQSSFAMCLSTVQEKTHQGYEATMELVVGKHETTPSADVEEAIRKAEVEGQHATSSVSSSMANGLEATKGALQQGADRAQAALKPKSKVGGA